MAQVEIIMPKMGESITEATVLSWLKKPGDKIEHEESLLEVATDKVDTEIPSTHAGILKEILVQKGELVQVGAPIAILTVESEIVNENTAAPVSSISVPAFQGAPLRSPVANEITVSHTNGKDHSVNFKSSQKFFSPLVKNIAKEENISVAELETIEGSGAEGRITKRDILDYVENRKLGSTLKPLPHAMSANTSSQKIPVSIGAEDEIIEMDRMRKMIAERMLESKRIAPHVTSFVEADVTSIIFWRNKVKNEFQKRSGDPLTYTPFFIEAVVNAIKDYPMINIQVNGDKIIRKKEINIGMAVALPSGNLIVPVIKKCRSIQSRRSGKGGE